MNGYGEVQELGLEPELLAPGVVGYTRDRTCTPPRVKLAAEDGFSQGTDVATAFSEHVVGELEPPEELGSRELEAVGSPCKNELLCALFFDAGPDEKIGERFEPPELACMDDGCCIIRRQPPLSASAPLVSSYPSRCTRPSSR